MRRPRHLTRDRLSSITQLHSGWRDEMVGPREETLVAHDEPKGPFRGRGRPRQRAARGVASSTTRWRSETSPSARRITIDTADLLARRGAAASLLKHQPRRRGIRCSTRWEEGLRGRGLPRARASHRDDRLTPPELHPPGRDADGLVDRAERPSAESQAATPSRPIRKHRTVETPSNDAEEIRRGTARELPHRLKVCPPAAARRRH